MRASRAAALRPASPSRSPSRCRGTLFHVKQVGRFAAMDCRGKPGNDKNESADGHEEPDDRAAALALCPVSRETGERLDILARELRRWQEVKNLVGPKTLDRVWTRHIADSLQLLD